MQDILYAGRVALSPAVYLIFMQPELTDMTLSTRHTAIVVHARYSTNFKDGNIAITAQVWYF